jgi:hypothetical protein
LVANGGPVERLEASRWVKWTRNAGKSARQRGVHVVAALHYDCRIDLSDTEPINTPRRLFGHGHTERAEPSYMKVMAFGPGI